MLMAHVMEGRDKATAPHVFLLLPACPDILLFHPPSLPLFFVPPCLPPHLPQSFSIKRAREAGGREGGREWDKNRLCVYLQVAAPRSLEDLLAGLDVAAPARAAALDALRGEAVSVRQLLSGAVGDEVLRLRSDLHHRDYEFLS